MTTGQLRAEIHKAIDNLSDSALIELAKYISAIQETWPGKEEFEEFLSKFLKEDTTS